MNPDWLKTIPTKEDGVTCNIRDVAKAYAASIRLSESVEHSLLTDVATSGVSYERPGRYVEVQIDAATWSAVQAWRKGQL